jgi:O-antigen ligase/Tfp pilus assembly protein PilF
MKKILQIFIILLPLVISFSTSDPTISIRILFLSIFVSIVLLLFLFSKDGIDMQIVKHPFSIIYLLLISAYLISTYINGFTPEGKIIILKLYLFYVFLLFVLHLLRKFGIEFILKPILYFSLIISLLYFVQIADFYLNLFGFNLEKTNLEFNKLASTMANKNLMVSVQFLCLPLIIYLHTISNKFFKNLCVVTILLFILSLVLSQTRSVFVAIFVFVFVMMLFNRSLLKKKHYIYIFLSVILFLGTSFLLLKQFNRYDVFIQKMEKLINFSELGRYKLYNSTFQMIKDKPIIGVGAGNWKVAVWKYGLYKDRMGNSFAQRPHNDFLWTWSEGGILAMISYLLLFLIILRESYLRYIISEGKERFLYSLLFSVTVGYSIISFFDFPMERVPHNILFLIISSVVLSKGIKSVKRKIEIPKYIIVMFFLISTYSITFSYSRYQKEIHIRNAISFKAEGNNNLLIKAITEAYDPNYYEMDNTATPLLWYRGVGYFNLQRYKLALQDFNASYMVNPNHVHVLNNLATIYEIKGKHKKAKEYYYKSLEVIPTFKESRVNLSAILFNEKEYEQALDVILESKVYPYWRRKKERDNYDKYLKIIVNSWAKGLLNKSEEETLRIKNILNSFEKNPNFAEKKMREVKLNRDNEQYDYLTALIEAYKK